MVQKGTQPALIRQCVRTPFTMNNPFDYFVDDPVNGLEQEFKLATYCEPSTINSSKPKAILYFLPGYGLYC